MRHVVVLYWSQLECLSGVANLWALLVMREYRLTLFRVNEELSWLGILMIVAHHYDIVD